MMPAQCLSSSHNSSVDPAMLVGRRGPVVARPYGLELGDGTHTTLNTGRANGREDKSLWAQQPVLGEGGWP